jgi:small subunit ribosomal protein S21
MSKKKFNVEVRVSGNTEKCLKQIKKKMEREGIIRDIKRLAYFEPPTYQKRKKLMRAIKNNVMKNYEYVQMKDR